MKVTNVITLLRILLLPVLITLIVKHHYFIGLLLFLLLAFGDIIDSWLRRKYKLTKLGSFLDPLVDKIIIFTLLFVYVLQGKFWWIPFVIFLLREVTVNICRFLATRNELRKGSYPYRKPRTRLQYIIIFFLLLQDNWIFIFEREILILFTVFAVLISIASMVWFIAKVVKGVSARIRAGEKLSREKMVILVNRRSSGFNNKYRRRLLRTFARRRNSRIVYLPKKGDMFAGIAQQIHGIKNVIIAGGDGSFESALNHKAFFHKRLGFFPLGAGNAFYSYFYKGKRFNYLRSRFQFEEVPLDVLEVEHEHGRTVTTFLSLGVDAEVIRLSQETSHGFWAYFLAGAKAFFKARADYPITCTVDRKKKVWENCISITLAKIPYFGYGIRSLFGIVEPDDKHVYGVACVNTHYERSNKPIRIWALFLPMFGEKKPPMFSLKGKKINVRSKVAFPLQAGGEYVGKTKWVKVRVLRQQKVLMI
jgi:CDP-diacylglycerol---glycerol-3-phosphate 3-phosphatidyltransferase